MSVYPDTDRGAFPVILPMTTRWRDNDVYGHMNNVVYYEYFDTAVNQWLASSGTLDVPNGPLVGLVAESSCRFLSGVGYPEPVEIGVSTLRIGNSSVVYGLALFAKGAETASAVCRYAHVYVDAETRRPKALPDAMKVQLSRIKAGVNAA
ncbi:MAG: acyl-CoA thioesterase [Pikeienuella sp.]